MPWRKINRCLKFLLAIECPGCNLWPGRLRLKDQEAVNIMKVPAARFLCINTLLIKVSVCAFTYIAQTLHDDSIQRNFAYYSVSLGNKYLGAFPDHINV